MYIDSVDSFDRAYAEALSFSGGEPAGVSSDPIFTAMHPKQKAFFSHPAKAKALLKGRQAGGTYGVAMWLLQGWQRNPGQAAVYITKTATSATRRVWPLIQKIAQRFGIRYKADHSNLTLTMPNGYSVWVTGCKDKAEADKVRGEANGFVKIAIDEPATFGDETLEYLCTESADATLMQTNGDILLCGTPGPVPKGFWYKVCTSLGWHVDTFTALDNPFLDGQRYLEQYLERYGYKLTTPRVQREFFAKWVIDTESLVYISNDADFTENNLFWDLPTNRPPDFTTLGVDLGYAPDPCAFVVASSWLHLPNIWNRKCYYRENLTPDLIATEIRLLRRQYGVHRVLIDAGGGGKTTAMAVKLSYGVEVEATPKGEKRPKIDLMRGGINRHSLLFHAVECAPLIAEYRTIVWSDDRTNHHEMSYDHGADAAIQACLPHKQFAVDFVPADDPWLDISADKRAAFEEAMRASE